MWRLLLLFLLCGSSYAVHQHSDVTSVADSNFDDYSLIRRDDYSCGRGNPCSNGACCGRSGYCGYGPTYCGDGCVSNCHATAECGKFSLPANKTCPLNTCCSQYGFCGTTKDFCDKNCQSNCVLHPTPPSGSTKGRTLSKVIGYYEAWSARSKCHQTSPSDLPLDALTHLNYAFAYISPESFRITTMDAATPITLFDDIAALKLSKPDLKIFVSIGGWTFSDNNTITQPIFGDIARSSSKRATFANNVLAFLNEYGFDGVDIDWEYPGAPDRGGKRDDKENYVRLLQTLRSVFTKSGRDLGITFTAPSSYWYMRWFDLPQMLKYADWMNLMSYDLHGVWDSTNPIGSIIQAHTNLTEIKLAAELLWRVKVPPHQVALGFGFYGRAFTLQDLNCATPGCPFSGAADPGICSNTAGYLANYEIKQILDKNPGIKVIHDKTAAVKYFTYFGGQAGGEKEARSYRDIRGKNQWISYDDKDTFEAKVKWADSVGFGGSLIWASDQDDYDLTSHKALTGKDDLGKPRPLIGLGLALKPPPVLSMESDLGSKCFVGKDVVDLRNPQASSCSPYIRVGYDKFGCHGKDGECGLPICCPSTTGFKNCQWRGGGRDCNGQCHAGEVKVSESSWGGTPGESGTGRCWRGSKALCCEMSSFDNLISKCDWTPGNGKSCSIGYTSVAHKWDGDAMSTVFSHGSNFCCPARANVPLSNCHWVGQGDCGDNTCAASEVTLMTDGRGDSYGSCGWWRKKALCCTPNAKMVTSLDCNDADICEDRQEECEDEAGFDDPTDGFFEFEKRSYALRSGKRMWSYTDSGEAWLSKPKAYPGSPRTAFIYFDRIFKNAFYPTLEAISRGYPNGANVLKGDGSDTLMLKGGFSLVKDACSSTAVQFTRLADLPKKGFHAEHLQELQMIPRLLKTAATKVLPSGKIMKSAPIDPFKLVAGWHKEYPFELPRIGSVVRDVKGWMPPLNTPNGRIFEAMGSHAFRPGMSFLEGGLNLLKRNVMGFNRPVGDDKFDGLVVMVLEGNELAAAKLMTYLRGVPGVFNYLNDNIVRDGLDKGRGVLTEEIGNAHHLITEMKGFLPIWQEFEPDFYAAVVMHAQSWLINRILTLDQRLPHMGNVLGNPAVTMVLYQVAELRKAVNQIRFPME